MISVTYKTKNVCSKQISICVEHNHIKSVQFIGGCSGNLQGISKLVEGLEIQTAIEKLKGIKCGYRETSCPDQLAVALTKILEDMDE